MKRFQDQVAIITGGADGLGKGIAERIASEGGTIALFDINNDLLKKVVDQFKLKEYKVSGHLVDVSAEEMVIKSIAEVEALYGRIDIMVNSAGIVGPTS
ncbi:MAG TPA: SDR family NAD(P)-dependent oxidoreductase, partial [Flavisolibacter sp.]|nr:SDR family NAD(P)-dependent oxidoreductase [Flavisolibacter sp.]